MRGVYFETGLSPCAFVRSGDGDWPARIGAIGEPVLLSRGRDCLYAAAKLIGLRNGDAVLVPAFICHEVPMLLREWGVEPLLYDIGDHLTVRPDELGKRLTPSTRAILYVNYYGLQQPAAVIEELRGLGLPLIEDNCQGPMAGAKRAVQPDFAFTSLRKYLPAPDGAVLDVIGDDWRGKAATIVISRNGNGRFVGWRTLALLARRSQEKRDRLTVQLLANELFSKAEQMLRSYAAPVAMHPMSRRLAGTFDVGMIRNQRRSAYEALAEGLAGHPRLTPLRRVLGAADCPYCFPVLADDNRLWRDALNQRGIQAAVLWEGEHIPGHLRASRDMSMRVLSIPLPNRDHARSVSALLTLLSEYVVPAGVADE